jgi:Dynamin family
LTALEDLVTERHNPGNRRHLTSVTVLVDVPVLARGVELVDTPGTGSVYAHNTAAAQTALETMDAAVFVLTADPPVSASERELMARVAARSVRMFVVLNKADYLAPGELAEALEFTGQVAGEAAGRPVRVYPMSARAALSAGDDPGFAAFLADFSGYLDRERAADLRLSAVAQARRLAGSLADEVALARRAAELRSGDAAGQVEAFAARLSAVAARRQDAGDLVRAESARMLAELNEAARRAAQDRTRQVGDELTMLLDGPLRPAAAAEIERSGRARLAELAVAAAESWRQRQAARLEDGLARLDARLIGGLRAELAAVRAAAADLLGLALTMPGGAERLTPDLRFFYLVAENAGQTQLLAGVIRRHLPGEAGRRRARGYLRREAAELVPRLIGRARADLQYGLARAG